MTEEHAVPSGNQTLQWNISHKLSFSSMIVPLKILKPPMPGGIVPMLDDTGGYPHMEC